MILRPALFAACAAAVVTTVGCSLPPVTTTEQSLTVRYTDFLPGAVSGATLPLVPAFSDQKAPVSDIPVPAEAKMLKLSSLKLNLSFENAGPVPLTLKLYLSRAGVDPYSTPALGGEAAAIELPRDGGKATRSFDLDPTLLQESTLRLGTTFSSPGTNSPATLSDDARVIVKHSITASAKLF